MPYKDAVTNREYQRRWQKARRAAHRPLSTAEIEQRIRVLGLAPEDLRPQIISINEPLGATEVDRKSYREWAALQVPFDGDEAGLEDDYDEESWP